MLLLVKDTKFESKSQPFSDMANFLYNCFYWSKIQNLKANHNNPLLGIAQQAIAFTGQRYKIWKQITTKGSCIIKCIVLLLLVKDTKFESKSQHAPPMRATLPYCFYWSKIQNLKANHNRSNNQERAMEIAFTGQRYKIWKQITTRICEEKALRNCFYWSKIQNLKANHNGGCVEFYRSRIAFTGQRYKIWKQITTEDKQSPQEKPLLLLVKDTKFESKSQQTCRRNCKKGNCFYWSKIQNLKANHNQMRAGDLNDIIAFTGQRYKIWKQITT